MTNTELDDIANKVMDYFTQQITELDNNECEHLLEQIVAKFDGLLERVRLVNNEGQR